MSSIATNSSLPIGVFDSGVGGISVLRALRAELPNENFVYLADSGHAPYGERDVAHVLGRAHAVTRYLVAEHDIKVLVVACNTATAAAILELRQTYPRLPIIGIEPSLKPAVALSKTGFIGVMATRGTLQSEKFNKLLDSLRSKATFVLQACDGLASAIEKNDVQSIATVCARHSSALGRFGSNAGEIDTLVLGCTHYPFITDQLYASAGNAINILDSGVPVARQTRRVLTDYHTLAGQKTQGASGTTQLKYFTTGEYDDLRSAVARWMGDIAVVTALNIPGRPSTKEQ